MSRWQNGLARSGAEARRTARRARRRTLFGQLRQLVRAAAKRQPQLGERRVRLPDVLRRLQEHAHEARRLRETPGACVGVRRARTRGGQARAAQRGARARRAENPPLWAPSPRGRRACACGDSGGASAAPSAGSASLRFCPFLPGALATSSPDSMLHGAHAAHPRRAGARRPRRQADAATRTREARATSSGVNSFCSPH